MLRSILSPSLAGSIRFAASAGVAPTRLYSNTPPMEKPSEKDIDKLFATREESYRPRGDNMNQQGQPQRKQSYGYSMNKVELIGGVATDPQLKEGKNGQPFTVINLITNSYSRDAKAQGRENSEFHGVYVFRKQAEWAAQNLRRGNRVMIVGKLHYTGGQEENGVRQPRQTHIHADTIQLIAAPSSNNQAPQDM